MKQWVFAVCVLLDALGFGGCASNGYQSGFSRHQKALAGTAMGVAGGALLGGAVTQDSDGAVVGGLLGGAAGGLFGHSMDLNQRPPPNYSGGYQQPYAYYDGGHRKHRRRHHEDDD